MTTAEEGFEAICAIRNGEDAGGTNMWWMCYCVFGNYTAARGVELFVRDVYGRLDKVTTVSEFAGLVAQLKLEVSDE